MGLVVIFSFINNPRQLSVEWPSCGSCFKKKKELYIKIV